MSRHYAVFGHPVSHSLSPRIHAAFGRQAGIAVEYSAIDVEPAAFDAALQEFAARGAAVDNVTHPL
jgi:shikimate dehydrogenase